MTSKFEQVASLTHRQKIPLSLFEVMGHGLRCRYFRVLGGFSDGPLPVNPIKRAVDRVIVRDI